jgi:hypothetical protein
MINFIKSRTMGMTVLQHVRNTRYIHMLENHVIFLGIYAKIILQWPLKKEMGHHVVHLGQVKALCDHGTYYRWVNINLSKKTYVPRS